MKVWVITEIIEYKDASRDRFVKGVYSSYKKAVKAIRNYKLDTDDEKYYGKVVGENPIIDGTWMFVREFYTDNSNIYSIMLQVNRKPMIVDSLI